MHKMFTRWSWALYSVNQNSDDIVLVVSDKMYTLQGNKDQLLKFIEDKATVKGQLVGTTIVVSDIVRPGKTS